jgi:hypothetical protein
MPVRVGGVGLPLSSGGLLSSSFNRPVPGNFTLNLLLALQNLPSSFF